MQNPIVETPIVKNLIVPKLVNNERYIQIVQVPSTRLRVVLLVYEPIKIRIFKPRVGPV